MSQRQKTAAKMIERGADLIRKAEVLKNKGKNYQSTYLHSIGKQLQQAAFKVVEARR